MGGLGAHAEVGAIARGENGSEIHMLLRLAEVGGHYGSLHARLMSATVVKVELCLVVVLGVRNCISMCKAHNGLCS